MVAKRTASKKTEDIEEKQITVDLKKIYSFRPEDLIVDISHSTYSNVAYIQVTGRDIFIDFLQTPGIKKDGKVVMNGTRVYMPFYSAQKLAEVLQNTLEKVHARGGLEQYKGREVKEEKN